MATWPSNLPGYNDQPSIRYADGVKRTPQDGGPARQSLHYSAVSVFYNGTMTFTREQTAIFNDFYFNTIQQAGEFTMEDPSTGTNATFRFAAAPQGSLLASADGTGATKPVTIMTIQLERLP